jgi:hypothetical protein
MICNCENKINKHLPTNLNHLKEPISSRKNRFQWWKLFKRNLQKV